MLNCTSLGGASSSSSSMCSSLRGGSSLMESALSSVKSTTYGVVGTNSGREGLISLNTCNILASTDDSSCRFLSVVQFSMFNRDLTNVLLTLRLI